MNNYDIATQVFGYGGVGETKQTWLGSSVPKYCETPEGMWLFLERVLKENPGVEIQIAFTPPANWHAECRGGEFVGAVHHKGESLLCVLREILTIISNFRRNHGR